MNGSDSSLDLRVRRTYKFLWDALMVLLAERDFESITVTDICKRAMVHRTTFYKHYEDKYGLLFHGIQDELNAFYEALDSAIEGTAPRKEAADVFAHLVFVFEHVHQREPFYRLMLRNDGSSKFSTLLKKSLAERIEHRVQKEGKQIAMPIELYAQLNAAVMVSMIAWWLENDRPYTPVEMTQFLRQEFLA